MKKNTVFNIIKSVTAIIFPIITFPYISRTLGVDNVGKISFSGSYVSYFALIAQLGVGVYAIRECAKFRADRDKLSLLSSEIFTLNLATTFVSLILLIVSLVCFRKIFNYRVLIVIFSFPILFSTLGADWINISLENIQYITIRTILFQIISLVLLFIFVKKADDYYKYAIIHVISSSGANILNIFYRKRFCDLRIVFNRSIFRHLKPILFLFVMSIAQTLYNNVDATMLGLVKGDNAVGIYYAAHRISGIISSIISSILWVVMPRISYYYFNKNFNEINKLLRKVFGFIISLGLPAIFGTYILSKDIILFLAGNGFFDSSIVLRILVIGLLFTFLGPAFLGNIILLPMNKEKYYMNVCVITSIINIVINYFVIPHFSYVGAAVSTVICSLISFVLLYIKVDKRIDLNNYFPILFKPFIGCIVILCVCYALRGINITHARLLFSIIVSVVMYFLSQVLLKNELCISFFKTIIDKIKFIKNQFV